jgi:molecular chaperone DnaK (HSP70)
VTPNEDKISCIKLFLQDGHKPIVLPSFVSASKTRAELKRHGRDVESAIADFLKKLHDHTMEHLTRRFGESFMRTTKKEFVLTIPAIWSSTGQLIMSKAAKRAGFGDDVKMISEVTLFEYAI